MFSPHRILHPTDYSDCARYAFQIAVDLARQYGAQLFVLHVADTLGAEDVSYAQAITERQPASQRHRLWEEVKSIQPPPGDIIDLQHILEEGDPATVIAEVATREHCDLIVMGTHGRSLLSRLLTGSVTQKVNQLVACPILTMRAPTSAV
jgi:nucleotide-binding universal stress UspA family protein